LATGIVILVIFAFLRSPRATLIPAVTIPVALVGTVAAIWLTGFSINTISLLALVLATGMVVDDAIVVVENIVRKRKEGMGAFAAWRLFWPRFWTPANGPRNSSRRPAVCHAGLTG